MIINAAYKMSLSASAYKISPNRPTFTPVLRRVKKAGKIVSVMPVACPVDDAEYIQLQKDMEDYYNQPSHPEERFHADEMGDCQYEEVQS